MSARGRFATAAAVLAVCLAVSAVYVLLFTTAAAGVWLGLGLASLWSGAFAVASLLGGGQVRGPEEPLELEPLGHPERYERWQGSGREPWGPGTLRRPEDFRGPGLVDPAARWNHPEDYR